MGYPSHLPLGKKSEPDAQMTLLKQPLVLSFTLKSTINQPYHPPKEENVTIVRWLQPFPWSLWFTNCDPGGLRFAEPQTSTEAQVHLVAATLVAYKLHGPTFTKNVVQHCSTI